MTTIRDLFVAAWLCETSKGTGLEDKAKVSLFKTLDDFLMQNRKEIVEQETHPLSRICMMVSMGMIADAYSLLQEEVL